MIRISMTRDRDSEHLAAYQLMQEFPGMSLADVSAATSVQQAA